MSSYRGAANGPDRTKAIVAVVAVHAALGFVIISGLNVRTVRQAVDQLKMIALPIDPPPITPEKPRPQPRPAAKNPQGEPAKKAEPAQIVAPPPKIPAPSPLPAAKIAGTGSATRSGAAAAGSGTGAGGSGNGTGGGGTDYSRFSPAQKISKIPNSEYRRFADTGMPYGGVTLTIRVTPDGSASNCRIIRGSGSRYADSLMCQLTERYVRFRPARDPSGRAVSQDVTWTPNWSPR
jgi:protein TonB